MLKIEMTQMSHGLVIVTDLNVFDTISIYTIFCRN